MDETIRQKADGESVVRDQALPICTHWVSLAWLTVGQWTHVPSDGLWDEARGIPHEGFLPQKNCPWI